LHGKERQRGLSLPQADNGKDGQMIKKDRKTMGEDRLMMGKTDR
jgi:hypothetical protein